MTTKAPSRDPYLVKSVVHSSQLLSAFRSSGEALPLREIAARSGLPKSMTFRLLYTLERCGMIEKVGENLYRSHLRPFKQRPYPARLRGAGHGLPVLEGESRPACSAPPRRRASSSSASTTATTPKIAQRNADVLVREKVDLVIEFQTDEHVAPIVAREVSRGRHSRSSRIEVPHPGATYFGANNYEAGLIGGRHLGRWAKQQLATREWTRSCSSRSIAPAACRSMRLDRHAGRHEGDLSAARELPASRISTATASSARASRRCAGTCARAGRAGFSIGAINDPSALGALRAMQEAGRVDALRDHGAERVARRARRAPPAGHAPDRLGRVLSRRNTAPRSSPSRSTSCNRRAGAAGGVREAPARDAGERQSHLSERPADQSDALA